MFQRVQVPTLLIGLGCVGFSGLAESLEGIATPVKGQQYRVRCWTSEDGLPQNAVKALAQTRDGYLWVGTLKGLARFDGVRFTLSDHNNTPELAHDSINALAADLRAGGLWIGTGSGLLYYGDHRFRRFGTEGHPRRCGRSLSGTSRRHLVFAPKGTGGAGEKRICGLARLVVG